MGTGKQYMSWIHMNDEVNAIIYLLENDFSGAFNLTAPNPVTAKDFSQVMGKTLHRPSWFTVPSFVVELLFGEMGREALLEGQRVVPQRLLDAGFQFEFSDLQSALKDLTK